MIYVHEGKVRTSKRYEVAMMNSIIEVIYPLADGLTTSALRRLKNKINSHSYIYNYDMDYIIKDKRMLFGTARSICASENIHFLMLKRAAQEEHAHLLKKGRSYIDESKYID